MLAGWGRYGRGELEGIGCRVYNSTNHGGQPYTLCPIPDTLDPRRGPERRNIMRKYVCDVCEYVYDPEKGDPDNGVPAGTPWEKVPEDWVCPLCGVGKDQFSPVD